MSYWNIAFLLYHNLTYRVFVHDQNFFLIYAKPKAFPGLNINKDFRKSIFILSIGLTEHLDMNTESSPCKEDPDYKFMQCVRKSLVRKVGCRLPWDVWTTQPEPACSQVSQLRRFDQEYKNLAYMELRMIVDSTGCKKPCHYMEYSLDGEERWPGGPAAGLQIQFTTSGRYAMILRKNIKKSLYQS